MITTDLRTFPELLACHVFQKITLPCHLQVDKHLVAFMPAFHCHSCPGHCTRKGTRNGLQLLRCGACGRYQRASYVNNACAPGADKRIALYTKEGCGIRSIARIMAISPAPANVPFARPRICDPWSFLVQRSRPVRYRRSVIGHRYLRSVSRNYKVHDQEDLHFLTYATVGWVDVFTRPSYKDILVESLRYCQQAKGLELFAWCIMSNHVRARLKIVFGSEHGEFLVQARRRNRA